MGAVELSDGGRIAFEDTGTGRPVVLVHGWATHGGFFEPQRTGLAHCCRVITLDLRGHGESDAPADAASILQLARDVGELFEKLDLTDVLAVGWSMGAMVLWEALDQHIGDRVAGLVVEDMSPRIVNDAHWRLGLSDGHHAAQLPAVLESMTRDWRSHCAQFVPRLFARGLDDERRDLMRWTLAQVTENDPHTMARLWRSMADQDFRPVLGRIKAPTLVLHGRLSQLYSEETSAAIVAAMPNAARLGLDRSGHAPHLEEPDEFNRILEAFSEQLGGRTAAQLIPSVCVS